MQLIYRGTTFNYDPTQTATRRPSQHIDESRTAYNLIYRGMTYQIDPNAQIEKITEQPRAYELIYRGMKYQVNRNAQGKVTAITETTIASKQKLTAIAHATSQQVKEYSLSR